MARAAEQMRLTKQLCGYRLGLRERTGQPALLERARRAHCVGPFFHSGGFDLRNCSAMLCRAWLGPRDHVGFTGSWPQRCPDLVSLRKGVRSLPFGHGASPLFCYAFAGGTPLRLSHMRGPVPIGQACLEPFCNSRFDRLVRSLHRRRWQYRGTKSRTPKQLARRLWRKRRKRAGR